MRRLAIEPAELAALEVLRQVKLSSRQIADLRGSDLQLLPKKVRVIVGRKHLKSGVVEVRAVFIPRTLAGPLLAYLAINPERDGRLFSVCKGGALRTRQSRARRLQR
ncbi:MAG TPA: hypothetical protein VGS22_16570 [Thermoanaerobaculia bacterium]|jgi:integrase|nr:hypothetical protein [Thermoanaerobaculia bacterium]